MNRTPFLGKKIFRSVIKHVSLFYELRLTEGSCLIKIRSGSSSKSILPQKVS